MLRCVVGGSLLAGLLVLSLCSAGGGADALSLKIDDFSEGVLKDWQLSSSPDYYKGGFGSSGLSIIRDAERGNALKARIAFTNPRSSEVAFITKTLADRPTLYKCSKVYFWYKITEAALDKERAIICRLRTSETGFNDYVVAAASEIVPNQWRRVVIDLDRPKKIVNIYANYFSRAREITFRIDDEDTTNIEFDFFVSDIGFELKEAVTAKYGPAARSLDAHKGVNTLVIKQSAAGYYGIEKAARSVPNSGRVTRLLFRGLHFPIFGFPAAFDELSTYDVVVLVDVDPYVLTLEQVKMLSDFVASGGGMLFAGGPNTFGAAKDFKAPLRDMLPVEFDDARGLAAADSPLKMAEGHPITRALPRLGAIRKVNPMKPREGAVTLLSLTASKPKSWGWYTGGGRNDAELSLSGEARSGKAGACLTLKDFYKDPKSGQPTWIGVALIQGDSDGYSGDGAYPAKPNTPYRFSFWAKGNVPKFRVECLGWKTSKAAPADREHIKTSLDAITPGSEWKKYAGTFSTSPATRTFVLSFVIQENPKSVRLGEKLFVDDVELVESGRSENLLDNPGAEEDASVPVLVVGEFHKGRVAVLNAAPDMAESTGDSFFTSDSYKDLVCETLTWTAGIEPFGWFREFSAPPGVVRRGETVEVRASLGTKHPLAAKVRLAVSKDGRTVDSQSYVVSAEDDKTIAFRYAIGPDYRADGRYEATVTVADALGDIVASRFCSFLVTPPVELNVEFLYGKAAFAPGSRMRFAVGAKPASGGMLAVRLCDAAGTMVHEFAAKPAQERTDFEYVVPEIEKGEYRLVANLLNAMKTVDAEVAAGFAVVDRLNMDEFFPIMSVVGTDGGGQVLDQEGVHERIDDLLRHGFNTIAQGGGKRFAAVPLPYMLRLHNASERYAQSQGMAVIYEYTRFTDIARDAPAPVCSFSPDYPLHFEKNFATDVEVCKAVPRLISFKILDEPTVSEKALDFCAHCQTAYRQKFGHALRKLKDIPTDAVWERLCHNEFVSDYVSAGYRAGYELKNRMGGQYGLLLTYMSTMAGMANIDQVQEDGYEWSRFADYVDFDVYPYFYPDSDKVRMVRAHWVFAFLRAVAAKWKKPWGFYVELDDRNYPFQINPARASSECAYTAIAQGCDYLNSFINTAFGTGTGARPERWEDCGRELRKIASVAPLLKNMRKTQAEVAFYFPHAQWYVQGRSYAPMYAYQLILRAFGECDILHEKVLREDGPGALKCIVLVGVDVLPDDCAEKLVAFAREGGVIIADRAPEKNQTGGKCALPAEFFGRDPQQVGGVRLAVKAQGKGRTVLFSDDLDAVFKDAVETPTPAVRDGLVKAMQKTLSDAGAVSHAVADNPEFETAVRAGRDSAMLIAVNHAAQKGRAEVAVSNLGFEPRFVCDLVTGRRLSARSLRGRTVVDLELDDRCAGLIGLYPEAVTGHELLLDTLSLAAGSRLRYTVRVKGERTTPAPGHHIVEVVVADSRGNVQPRYGGLLATTDGLLVRDLPLAVNAAKGKWTITVRDRYTTPNCRQEFWVR